jgi:hypothetical protein
MDPLSYESLVVMFYANYLATVAATEEGVMPIRIGYLFETKYEIY